MLTLYSFEDYVSYVGDYINNEGQGSTELVLSFQKINMYSRCGLQYYFRYIEGIKIPPTTNIVVGSAFHKAVETYYKNKRENKRDFEVDLLLDIYNDEIERNFQEEVLLEEEEFSKGKEKVKGEIKDSGTRALKVYHIERALHIDPFLVEEEFVIDLEEVAKELNFDSEKFKGIKLLGYVDLVNTEGKVIDNKVKKKVPQSDEAHKSQQLTIYALGYREILGELPSKVVLDNIILPVNKGSMGKIISLESKRSEEDIKRLLRRIIRVVEGIRKEVFIPPDQGSWACSYCGYKKFGICNEYIS